MTAPCRKSGCTFVGEHIHVDSIDVKTGDLPVLKGAITYVPADGAGAVAPVPHWSDPGNFRALLEESQRQEAIADVVKEAQRVEREACAAIAQKVSSQHQLEIARLYVAGSDHQVARQTAMRDAAEEILAAIRSRTNKPTTS